MNTLISQYFDELDLGPTMANIRASRRSRSAVATSESILGDAEITYELQVNSSGTPNVPTTDISKSLNSKFLELRSIEHVGRSFQFSGKEEFTVSFKNTSRRSRQLTCSCANAAPCSVSSIRSLSSSQCF